MRDASKIGWQSKCFAAPLSCQPEDNATLRVGRDDFAEDLLVTISFVFDIRYSHEHRRPHQLAGEFFIPNGMVLATGHALICFGKQPCDAKASQDEGW